MDTPRNIMWFDNGNVMVFDAAGEQLPQYQGEYGQVVETLRSLDLSQCQFEICIWRKQTRYTISKEEFFTPTTLVKHLELVPTFFN